MGVTTDGQISYGVAFEEEFEFPWSEEREGDIYAWWIYDVLEFKHSTEIYADTKSGYVGDVKPAEDVITAYHKERREFSNAHPLPVEVVNYCAGEYPMHILAVPRTVKTANRGEPTKFDPEELTVTDAERDALLKFCADHGITHEEPAWMLTSYWG
jgi:hypothetical protein